MTFNSLSLIIRWAYVELIEPNQDPMMRGH